MCVLLNSVVKVDLTLEIVKAVYRFLKFSVKEFRDLWNWAPLFGLLQHSNEEIKAFSYQCVILLLGVSENRVRSNPTSQRLLSQLSFILK
jgi:hypothetical protein